jgi:ABC-type phosphate transport system substrate-binding protein
MIAVVVLTACALHVVAAEPGFKVVVNDANPVSSVDKARVSRLFLKKQTAWDNGLPVVPVDHDAGSSVRVGFSQAVHGRGVDAIKSYWQRMIFTGRAVPPPERASDEEILVFIRANPGAIGYVAAGTDLEEGVKVLEIRDL